MTGRPALTLLPSPLLGPAVWAPVAEELRTAEWDVSVVAVPDAVTGDDVLAGFAADLGAQPTVLVAHSNAGAFVPALSVSDAVVGAVFVDAVLPAADTDQPLAPPAMLDGLRELADADGLLPVWTQWWDAADVAELFPDDETQQRIAREQRRLPVSYFEGVVPVPPGWDALPVAYLAFGDTYREEHDRALAAGRPVRRLAGSHLHQLVAADAVAAAIAALVTELLGT